MNKDTKVIYAVWDDSIAFVTMMGYAATVAIADPTVWLSAVLVLCFAIAFYMLTPKAPQSLTAESQAI